MITSTHDLLTVMKHLANGHDPAFVAAAIGAGTTEAHVETAATEWGWPDKQRMEFAVDELTRQIRQAERNGIPKASDHTKAALRQTVSGTRPTTSPLRPPAANPAPAVNAVRPVVDSPTGLLARADKLDDGPGTAAVRRAAKKAREAILALELALGDVENQRRVAAEEAAERAKALDKVKRLERELAAAKAALKKSPPRSPRSEPSRSSGRVEAAATVATTQDEFLSRHGVTVADVRAWAHDNDVECPVSGRFLPASVRDAYDQAHTGTAA